MSVSDAKILRREPLDDKRAVWTKLVLTTYTDPSGKERDWESAERPTRPKGSDIDGVGIVAILDKPTGPEIILQKQYRPPIDKVVIEVPAGLVDAGESGEVAAVRELREETGYVGKVTETSPVMFNGELPTSFRESPQDILNFYSLLWESLFPLKHLAFNTVSRGAKELNPKTMATDPGFCNTNLRMIHVSVDMSLPENQNLKPDLEDNEFIEVFTLPLTSLWEECKKLEQEGYAIDARVGTLAEGIELAKKWKF